ncbi:MAG TPA: hypothetical protein VLJ79_06815, partial [Candidatus Binatia bacterium]|nr:hypothetical protein [Candidatus Binatia bacterium]
LAGRRTIPFDYAFRYELTGKPGNVINKTVTVSIEAPFIAVSIGYGVVPKVTPIIFGPADLKITNVGDGTRQPTLREISLQDIIESLDSKLIETSRTLTRESGPEAALKNGFRLNLDVAEFALLQGGNVLLASSILKSLFQVVAAPPENIQFLYAIFDEGSGREFQSEPILNIAGLGISNGDRPFRYFAKPIAFAPQSTIRMEVREVSDFQGELHVVLHGYKMLGSAGTPTGTIQRRAGKIRRR